jgi:hypothetical protein
MSYSNMYFHLSQAMVQTRHPEQGVKTVWLAVVCWLDQPVSTHMAGRNGLA